MHRFETTHRVRLPSRSTPATRNFPSGSMLLPEVTVNIPQEGPMSGSDRPESDRWQATDRQRARPGDTFRTTPETAGNSSETAPDEEAQLLAEVRRALAETGQVALLGINPNIDNGCVVLEGQVSTYYQKQLAQQAVMSVAGVRCIDNRIAVE